MQHTRSKAVTVTEAIRDELQGLLRKKPDHPAAG